MQRTCGAIFAALLFAMPLWGQNAGSKALDVPQGAVPSAPITLGTPAGKTSFTLPPERYDRPTGPVRQRKLTPEEECPGDLQKPVQEQPVPKEVEGAVRNYEQLVATQINDSWQHSVRSSIRIDAWAPGRVLALQFSILPDGTYTTPTITSTSGKSIYDRLALDAVRMRNAYPPPPTGGPTPLKMCIRFAYNVQQRSLERNYDDWQKPDAEKP